MEALVMFSQRSLDFGTDSIDYKIKNQEGREQKGTKDQLV